MPAVNINLHTTDRLADARALLNAGAEIALSTDYNPGSAMTFDIGTILWLGCALYRLTPGEALRAATIGAAKALRREEIGRIREGAPANLALFAVPEPAYIPYHPGAGHIEGVVQNGELVYWTEQESV